MCFFLAIPAVYALVAASKPGVPQLAAFVYGLSLLLLLGTSALYHRRTWGPLGRTRGMKNLDHSMIFVLIAGSYTDLLVRGRRTARTDSVHRAVGRCRPRYRADAVLADGTALAASEFMSSSAGREPLVSMPSSCALVQSASRCVFGGVLYTLGALAYARKRPDPFRRSLAITRSSTPSWSSPAAACLKSCDGVCRWPDPTATFSPSAGGGR